MTSSDVTPAPLRDNQSPPTWSIAHTSVRTRLVVTLTGAPLTTVDLSHIHIRPTTLTLVVTDGTVTDVELSGPIVLKGKEYGNDFTQVFLRESAERANLPDWLVSLVHDVQP